MRIKSAILAAMSLATFTLPAMAEEWLESPGFYTGVSYGAHSMRADQVTYSMPMVTNTFVGAKFSDRIGMELGYGFGTAYVNETMRQLELTALVVSGVYRQRLSDRVSVAGRMGVSRNITTIGTSLNNGVLRPGTTTTNGFIVGVMGEYALNNSVSLRLSFDQFSSGVMSGTFAMPIESSATAQAINFSLVYGIQ